jgi:predicted thioesterase
MDWIFCYCINLRMGVVKEMKVFCPECLDPMDKVKIKVGEHVNVKHYECAPCGVNLRIED